MKRLVDILWVILALSAQPSQGCKSQSSTTTVAPTSTRGPRGGLSRAPNNPPYVKWTSEQSSTAAVTNTSAPPECRCGTVRPTTSSWAVSGVNASKGEFPWQVALVFYGKTKPFCSGSLISSKTVLTAAHCYTNTTLFKVVLNGHTLDVNAGQTSVTPASFLKHPNFNSSTLDYDIGLVTLASEINFTSSLGPVCLPDQQDIDNSRRSTVTGWGTMYADGQQSMTLQKVDAMTMDNPVCVSKTGGLYAEADLSPRMVCAQETGRNTCVGDHGSPLLTKAWNGTRFQQTGVLSWGAGCRQIGAPSVFSRVSSMKNWIETSMTGRTCPP